MTTDRTSGPLPTFLIITALLCCGSLFFLLRPNDAERLKRQIQDGNVDSAVRTLEKILRSEKGENLHEYALMRISLRRQQFQHGDQSVDPGTLLSEAALLCRQLNYDAEVVEELWKLLPLQKNHQVTWQTLEPHLSMIEMPRRKQFYTRLSEQALAASDSPGAAAIFSEFSRKSPPDPELLRDCIRLWRSGNLVANAVDEVKLYLERTGQSASELPAEVALDFAKLLRETERPSQAFEVLLELFESSEEQSDSELMDLLVGTAKETDRSATLEPILQEYLDRHPTATAYWEMLAELAASRGNLATSIKAYSQLEILHGDEGRFAFKIGQQYEWTNRPNEAFDAYVKALEYRDRRSIDKLLNLGAGLLREDELAQHLWRHHKLVADAGKSLELARLLRATARYESAGLVFSELCSKSTTDVALLEEYGELCIDLFDYPTALHTFEAILELGTSEVDLAETQANIHTRMGNYDRALNYWRRAAFGSNQPDTTEGFIRLATSLGETQAIIEGLQYKIAYQDASETDYLRCLSLQLQSGHFNDALETSRQVTRVYPHSQELLLGVAFSLHDVDKLAEATELLGGSPLTGKDPKLARLHLDILMKLGRPRKAADFLIRNVDPTLEKSQTFLELEAYIFDRAQRNREAAETRRLLYERHPTVPKHAIAYAHALAELGDIQQAKAVIEPLADSGVQPALRAAVYIYSRGSDYDSAHRFLQAYMEAVDDPSAEDWRQLGDLLTLLNRTSEAREAYERGLQSTIRKITGKTQIHSNP